MITYYKFTAESAGEKISIIGAPLANLQARTLTVSLWTRQLNVNNALSLDEYFSTTVLRKWLNLGRLSLAWQFLHSVLGMEISRT